MKNAEERQVFFDPSGRRWRWVRVTATLLLIASGAFLFHIIPRALESPPVPAFNIPAQPQPQAISREPRPTALHLANSLVRHNLPIIGEGSLVRVVRLTAGPDGLYSVEPFTQQVTKKLTTTEGLTVGKSEYAIERYGKTSGKHIALTFDDGPDPVYSGQILDALSERSIPATFFVVGENVIKHPDMAQRMVREGHVIANHTFFHANLSYTGGARTQQEIAQTQRAIRSVTHSDSAFFRIPYGGDNDQSMRNNLRAILNAQELGYIVTSFNFDTNDWDTARSSNIPLPDMTKEDTIVMLLHDSGGDRSHTVAYLRKLAEAADKHGYTFVNLNQLYPQQPALFTSIQPTLEDNMSFIAASSILHWPHNVIRYLFVLTVFSILLSLIINTILSAVHMRRTRYGRRANNYQPRVTVLVPAYNESTVIIKTVRSLLKSSYKNLEVIIIDDGSKDDTWEIAKKLSRKSKRVRSFTQPNGGKAAALNNGISRAKGEIIICVDADTVFPPNTVTRLVRHFKDPSIGAVAGSVKVGNVRNFLARWQALEYTVSIHLERTAHACLGAIMIVPGACGAWRKDAVLAAGGYSKGTLAEDCDLTLAVHKAGYRVIQDNSAVGYTEVPLKLAVLAKQRFRWIFGNMQSFWKHRHIAFNPHHGWLGMFIMPYAIFNIIMPLVFIPTLITLALENIAAGQFLPILFYASITLLIQFLASVIGVMFAKERLILLSAAPLTRLIYSPLKTYLLYKSLLTIVKGAHVGWNKIQRTGTVSYLPAVKTVPVRSSTKH